MKEQGGIKRTKGTQKSVAFFEKTSWYHRTKTMQEDGTVKYSKLGGFKDAKEAEESYARHEEKFENQQRSFQMNQKPTDDILLKDYLIYWFEEVFSLRIENTTRMIGAYTIYNLLLPSMEYDIKLKYLNVEYLDALLEKVSHICKSAGNQARAYLYMALKEAVIEDRIRNNPVAETKLYHRPKPKIVVLSKENVKRLLNAASMEIWYLETLLGLFCGLRKGEIYGLKFSDFDLKEGTVKITRQLSANFIIEEKSRVKEYSLIEKQPKTPNSYRTLKVPEVILQELQKRRQLIDLWRAQLKEKFIDNDYISCQQNGKPHSLSAFNAALKKMCIGNTVPAITVHGLRHMFATILLERAVPLVKISGLLGHSSIHTTFEYYCEIMDEKEKIIAFMNNEFEVKRTGTEG